MPMPIYRHTDHTFRFSSCVEIGNHTLSIEIDGLEKQFFVEQNLSGFLHSTPEAIAKLLQFDRRTGWQIGVTRAQMLTRMKTSLEMRDYGALYGVIDVFSEELLRCENPSKLWNAKIHDKLIAKAYSLELRDDHALDAVIAWCHPANTSKQLHPRAMQFLSSHWPALLQKIHSKQAQVV